VKNLCLLFLILQTFFVNAALPDNGKDSVNAITRKAIAHFLSDNTQPICSYFDSTLNRQLSHEDLQNVWNKLLEQTGGNPVFSENSTIDTITGFYTSYTPVSFKKGKMILYLSFNSRFQISGIFFQPKVNYLAPEYVNSLSFYEVKTNLGKYPYYIEGVMSIPLKREKPPCVIIIGGSGPTDKDGTNGSCKPYKDIAWGLASKGIAVFRFDKRTAGNGSYMLSEKQMGKELTLKEEYIDDVKAAVYYVSHHPSINHSQVFIMGHSQGGMLIPLFAKYNSQVKGMIMLAANARPMQDLMIEQLNFLYGNTDLPEKFRTQIEATKRFAGYAKTKPLPITFPEDSLPGASAAYWNSVNAYDPISTFIKIKKPCLLMQGQRDYQVTTTDFELWKKHNATRKLSADFKLYPALNHIFCEGSGKPSPNEYEQELHVAAYVINDLRDWIENLP
jgi:dienelactone hydrolase